ncbi:MAG: hypothetical protein NVS1B14_10960 [Vulcanimicrobiaceae bacterium]
MLQPAKAPDPWRVLRGAFARAGSLVLRDNFVSYLILAIFSVIDGALMRNFTYRGKDLLDNSFPLSAWLSVIAFYFTLAAALRARDPSYKRTVSKAFGVTTTFFISLLATVVGMLFLIVPGIWVGTKLSLAPFAYSLAKHGPAGTATDAVSESWNLTTGYFWPTVGLALLQILLAFLPPFLLLLAALAAFERSHFSAYVSAPLLIFVNVYFTQVNALALLEWTSELRAYKSVPEPAPPQADGD